ncbi:hypothetical protein Vadar_007102 [Vaccinium darrowii]|uniref:Uncharacterized protein n=1 Tax=Vaccinium darrowii TaxID=229202 RepID=A0ACB7ZHY6_9ERIC|nr:hypothetical protein Vadar_007102 [Vaccinium darrowii]
MDGICATNPKVGWQPLRILVMQPFVLDLCILDAYQSIVLGVYADVDFKEGDLVLKDQMLDAAQHSANKIDCLVCSFYFRFIGSIEVQIGRKLYLQDLGVAANNECDR